MARLSEGTDVQHPAAKCLLKSLRHRITKSAMNNNRGYPIRELLAKAEALLDKNIHPTLIIEGYKKASEKAQEILGAIAMPVAFEDDKALREVAITSISSKSITVAEDNFAKIIVDSVKQVSEKLDNKYVADID